MRKILIFSLAYYPDFIGGAEIAIKEITDRIPSRETYFDMVTAKLNRRQKRYERVGNINVYRVGIGQESFDKFSIPIFGLIKAIFLQKENNYDISWCIMANQASVTASFFKLIFRKVPLILTIQEGDEEEHLKRYVWGIDFLYQILVRPWHKMSFKLADRATAISSYLKKRIENNGFKGAIDIVPNGVDLEAFSKKYSEKNIETLRKKLNIRKDQKIIITTSRLEKKNAIEDLILSLKYLPKKYKLLILGTGSLLYKLQNLVEKENLYERVKFLGFIDREEIPKYLNVADVFARPSLSEGMGNSFIEAMASGIPIIATSVGGITDFLKDSSVGRERATGLFCEVKNPKSIAEKIKILEKDKELKKLLVKNARNVSKDYNWDKIAQETLQIFKNTAKISRKILIVTGDKGGPVTYSNILKNRLTEYGFKPELLSFSEIRHLPKIWGRFVFMIKIKWRGLFSDTIYAQDPVSVGFPAMLVAKILRKRFVLKIVGDYAWEQGLQRFGVKDLLDDFSSNNNYGFEVKFFKRVQKIVANSADKIIVPSSYLKNIVSNWEIDLNKIEVIHNSFKKVGLSKKNELRKKLGFSNQKTIISSGRLVPWKGFDALLEIMPNLPERRLLIAGEGPEKEKLLKLRDNLNLENRVEFLGQLEHRNLLEHIKASDLFVLNSSYEGFSHLLLEAMSQGTPIVATKIGGNPELITDGKNGLLVDNGNNGELLKAMNKILDNSELSSKLSANGLERIQGFTENIMLEKLIKVL